VRTITAINLRHITEQYYSVPLTPPNAVKMAQATFEEFPIWRAATEAAGLSDLVYVEFDECLPLGFVAVGWRDNGFMVDKVLDLRPPSE